MSYNYGAIETALAAAIGEDSGLIVELRGAFRDSAVAHLNAMASAVDPEEWQDAAQRMKGLAASFGALGIMDAAGAAMRSGPDDGRLAKLRDAIENVLR